MGRGLALVGAMLITTHAITARAASVCYQLPFNNPDLADGFGSTMGRSNPHRGVDFPQASGTPIPAVADGVVRIVTYNSCLGNEIVLEHADGVFSGYSHMVSPSPLSVGKVVKRGDVVGYVGNTGTCSFGSHLHLSMATSLDGYCCEATVFDPYAYINGHKECAPPTPPVAQVTGNGAMTLINWPTTKHAELFVKTKGGELQHLWTSGTSDVWSPPESLGGGTTCGFAAAMRPRVPAGEIFTPTSAGSTVHSWWEKDKGWTDFNGFDGEGMTKLSTLAWPDGHVEVFALGPDKAIWHTWSDKDWSTWESLGGRFVTGANPILWGDGHAEIFATDEAGVGQHLWASASNGWSSWATLANAAGVTLATEPVPARWKDGEVEVFARGNDNHLYHSYYDDEAGWTPFRVLGAGTSILGVPSVISFVAQSELEIFARNAQGKVVHIWWNGSAWGDFAELGDQVAQSDPFGWTRADGAAEVFAVDAGGNLVRTYLSNDGWSAWSPIAGASGIDACIPPGSPGSSGPAADGNGDPNSAPTGSGDGRTGNGAPDEAADGSNGCSVATSSTTDGAGIFGLALSGVLAAFALLFRRRRSSAR